MKKPWKIDPSDESCSDLQNITIFLNRTDGSITLMGLPYREFKSLLVGASIHRSDHPFVPQYVEDPSSMMGELQIENGLENQRWTYAQKDLIRYLIGLMDHMASGGVRRDPKASIALERKTRRLDPEPHYTTVSPEQKEKTEKEKMFAELNEARSNLINAGDKIWALMNNIKREP